MEKETGFRYVDTYFAILGLGDYECEEWWATPDWAAADNLRASGAWEELTRKAQEFTDFARPLKTRVMRTASEVKIAEPP